MSPEKISNGHHIILDLYGCDQQLLNNYDQLYTMMKNALELANATVLKVSGEKFEPQGVTIFALLAESHCSIHTWPEIGYCAVDFYTCGTKTKSQAAVNYLTTALNAHKATQKDFTRYAFAVAK
ncbi:MAG: adenosylmethionine decarboxylase [Flavobacteriaceae bacterium]